MTDEITDRAYSRATESVAKEHDDAVAKTKAAVAKAKSDALKKLSS